MSLGDNLKNLRKSKKLTQKDLAMRSGITRESIGNYERGDRIPPADVLAKIADALDIPVTHILGITTTMPNGGTLYSSIPDEIKNLYPPKKLTEEQIEVRTIKRLKEIQNLRPMDKYIQNIYERYLQNKLTKEDKENINTEYNDYKNALSEGYNNPMNTVYAYEREAYNLFKNMLETMGYNLKEIDTFALFRVIKTNIEFGVYLNYRDKYDD